MQADLKSSNLVQYIEAILDSFNVCYRKTAHYICCACPIHGGDNPTALTIFTTPKGNMVGNWKCWTNQCEAKYGNTILDFVRGLLDISGVHTNTDAINYVLAVINNPQLKRTYSGTRAIKQSFRITRTQVRQKLTIPAKYYLNLGFSASILNKYDIGTCYTKAKSSYMRIVVPIYDIGYNYVYGCMSRTMNPQCPKCNKYHYVHKGCPTNTLEEIWSAKWRSSSGFSPTSTLFNIWFAKQHIADARRCILVEGVGDVLRLEEAGIHIGLGLLGAKIGEKQVELLDILNPLEVVVATDNDNGGNVAYNMIKQELSKYNLVRVQLPKKDIGDMSVSDIQKCFA